MQQSEVLEAYNLLAALCKESKDEPGIAYKQMRDLLERICRAEMVNESLQMTDLAARINFVSHKAGLTYAEQNRLHTFRLTSNRILNHQQPATTEHFLRDAKSIAFFVRKLSGEEIPHELYTLLPRVDATYIVAPPAHKRVQRMRVCFQEADEQYLYVMPVDEISEHTLRVRYNIPEVNEEFADTCRLLWQYAQLNLLDVGIDADGILTPAFIVLEPDYLIDISSLAECFKEYGSHPGNYFLSRLQPIANARPLLLGNIANLFLDEWIHATPSYEPDYKACMQKAFRRYPIELAACSDLHEVEKERQFFDDCKLHFDHIRQTVVDTFHATGYGLDKQDAVLEPSYICEALGLQGRLDYMQRDMSSFIEMKSGKADEYAIRGKVEPKENNRVQMLLYQAVLQYSMGMDHRDVKAYLLYTRYPLLYPARSSWAMVRRAINVRNRIVAAEYHIQLRNDLAYTATVLEKLTSDTLNERHLQGRFWETWLRPPIDGIQQKLQALSAVEKEYFYALYNFITKELYTSKSGDVEYEGRTGAVALWLSTLEEKREAGEILYDLRINKNQAADEEKPLLTLVHTQAPAVGTANDSVPYTLPNFRQGDAVILYQRNTGQDNATNRMVFKGNIETMGEEGISIRLRSAQQNAGVLPSDSLYAIEHDVMDGTFRAMYHGLYAFLTATQERRDLLLSKRPPRFDDSLTDAIATTTDDFARIALEARAAQDYFLLIGPPGTGKTSCALKKMVETFHAKPDAQLLLLSYTNRAVDEICKSLTSIRPEIDFIRVGNELSCEKAYRPHLIENVLASCRRRSDVNERIRRCRIFVGTVATMAGKPELFRLKHFDVAIIDEATQILEPQLLGILCMRGEDGRDGIGKFILIGDHKQLPAVVLQRSEQSGITAPALQAIGLTNLKDSLFERLYRHACQQPGSAHRSFDMLCRQGRMHPVVASFANQAFYEGRLEAVGLPHQVEPANALLRLAFYPSVPEPAGMPSKVNHSEARIVADLVASLYAQLGEVFDPTRSLGIITPYRSQIALIRQEIERLGIPALNRTLIDTVERFQGSERDTIIYSFCVNHPYQLHFLSNLTESDGVLIDRKLNVALTRARKQMFITGVPEILRLNPIYKQLLESMGGGKE
ncbi:MAG: AAA family ATPase [Mediterranea sp.]|jgi:hypothetical protein|nr:AAA family ATPase [Mediterranea sp.]